MSDNDETTPGGFLCVNDDDDNNNGIPDKDDVGAVTGEDDLVTTTLSILPAMMTGSVELRTIASGSRIKVYQSADRSGTSLRLPKTWILGQDVVPPTIYVEGTIASTVARDVLLRLKYANGVMACNDVLRLMLESLPHVCQLEVWFRSGITVLVAVRAVFAALAAGV